MAFIISLAVVIFSVVKCTVPFDLLKLFLVIRVQCTQSSQSKRLITNDRGTIQHCLKVGVSDQ